MHVMQLLCVMFQEATVDIKLPRRSLLVQFTCNACGERTQRLINRVAYERGTVFLQVNFVLCVYVQIRVSSFAQICPNTNPIGYSFESLY